MKWIKKLLFSVIIILLLPLLIFNIYNFINIKVLKNDITSFFGYAVLEVISGSMEPTIQVGDMIIIDRNAEEYKPGDVITYYDENNSFITHRIKEIKKDKIITAGDYTKTEDDPITKDKVVGKYLFKIDQAGKILKSFQNPLSMIMIFLVGLFACIFLSVDKDGKPILTSEEKELEEYRLYKELKAKFEPYEKQEEREVALKEPEKDLDLDLTKKEEEFTEEEKLLEQEEIAIEQVEEPEEEIVSEVEEKQEEPKKENEKKVKELEETKEGSVEIKTVAVSKEIPKKNSNKETSTKTSNQKRTQVKKINGTNKNYSKNKNTKKKSTNQVKKK